MPKGAVPTIGRIVWYRGKTGCQAMRPAIVTGDYWTVGLRGVEAGAIPAVSSVLRAHLWVFSPGGGGFAEYDVPPGGDEGVVNNMEELQPGAWCWPVRG